MDAGRGAGRLAEWAGMRGTRAGRVVWALASGLLVACDGSVPEVQDAMPGVRDAATESPDAGAHEAGTREGGAEDGGEALDAGPAPRATRVSVIDPYAWVPLGAADDSFEDRPDDVTCLEEALETELLGGELSYSVDTGMCDYVTAAQATTTHVAVGETVEVRVWHFDLTAPDPGEAHVVVDLDGAHVLDARVPIPSKAGLLTAEVPVDHFVPAGSEVRFHLHNHGDNSWSLVEVSAGM